MEASLARPVRRALQLLLERPALAERVKDLELLATADAPGVGLLVETIEYFREHPGSNAGQLLELWRDDERGPVLDALAATRLELDEASFDEELRDALAHLAQKGLRARAQALLAEARQRELSPAERKELDLLSRELVRLKTV